MESVWESRGKRLTGLQRESETKGTDRIVREERGKKVNTKSGDEDYTHC